MDVYTATISETETTSSLTKFVLAEFLLCSEKEGRKVSYINCRSKKKMLAKCFETTVSKYPYTFTRYSLSSC